MIEFIDEPTELEIATDADKVIKPMPLVVDSIKSEIFSTYPVGVICALGLGYVLCAIAPPSYFYRLISAVVQAIPALPALPTF